eukprot:5644637-Prymnesium_polylepis.1
MSHPGRNRKSHPKFCSTPSTPSFGSTNAQRSTETSSKPRSPVPPPHARFSSMQVKQTPCGVRSCCAHRSTSPNDATSQDSRDRVNRTHCAPARRVQLSGATFVAMDLTTWHTRSAPNACALTRRPHQHAGQGLGCQSRRRRANYRSTRGLTRTTAPVANS